MSANDQVSWIFISQKNANLLPWLYNDWAKWLSLNSCPVSRISYLDGPANVTTSLSAKVWNYKALLGELSNRILGRCNFSRFLRVCKTHLNILRSFLTILTNKIAMTNTGNRFKLKFWVYYNFQNWNCWLYIYG